MPESRGSASRSAGRRAPRQCSPPARRKVNPKLGIQLQIDEELAKLGREDDPIAAVGPCLKVKGIKGLRAVDASNLSEITSDNTNALTLMIAEKAARWFQESRSR